MTLILFSLCFDAGVYTLFTLAARGNVFRLLVSGFSALAVSCCVAIKSNFFCVKGFCYPLRHSPHVYLFTVLLLWTENKSFPCYWLGEVYERNFYWDIYLLTNCLMFDWFCLIDWGDRLQCLLTIKCLSSRCQQCHFVNRKTHNTSKISREQIFFSLIQTTKTFSVLFKQKVSVLEIA